jgi:hypothetical protein
MSIVRLDDWDLHIFLRSSLVAPIADHRPLGQYCDGARADARMVTSVVSKSLLQELLFMLPQQPST